MSTSGSSGRTQTDTSSSKSSSRDPNQPPTSTQAAQDAKQAQPGPGAQINFPSVLHIGRHLDGDTDEINVIICTQRSRRRHAGELPRCYTLGWRHINNFEVPPLGKPSAMPPKLGQQREVPGFWKERIVGQRDVPTWEGFEADEDIDPMERPLNVVDKPDEWTEGNYISVGRGSSSAHEKILAMNVPLHSYDLHRRFREELWTAEKVAENMAKHHAQLQKQRLKPEESQNQKVERIPKAVLSSATSSQSSTAKSSVSASVDASPKEQANVSSLPSTSSTSTVKAKALTHDKDASTSSQPSPPSPSPAPIPPPVDRRFAPEKIARLPWYRKLTNYTPPPTGWTSDEEYGHRSYIIPHPIRAAKDNLMRSWATVLTPTWKLTKALGASFTSGSQTRVWGEVWKYSREGGQVGLITQARATWRKKVLDESERIEKEKQERSGRSPPSSSGGSSSS